MFRNTLVLSAGLLAAAAVLGQSPPSLPSSFRGATIQAADLMKDHTLVVPDLRGIGRSAKPEAAMTRKPRPKICAPL